MLLADVTYHLGRDCDGVTALPGFHELFWEPTVFPIAGTLPIHVDSKSVGSGGLRIYFIVYPFSAYQSS